MSPFVCWSTTHCLFHVEALQWLLALTATSFSVWMLEVIMSFLLTDNPIVSQLHSTAWIIIVYIQWNQSLKGFVGKVLSVFQGQGQGDLLDFLEGLSRIWHFYNSAVCKEKKLRKVVDKGYKWIFVCLELWIQKPQITHKTLLLLFRFLLVYSLYALLSICCLFTCLMLIFVTDSKDYKSTTEHSTVSKYFTVNFKHKNLNVWPLVSNIGCQFE